MGWSIKPWEVNTKCIAEKWRVSQAVFSLTKALIIKHKAMVQLSECYPNDIIQTMWQTGIL